MTKAVAVPDIRFIPTKLVDPSPFNPRKEFAKEALQELAADMQARGQMQPGLVREYDGRFHLVFGERRLRAAELVGLDYLARVVPYEAMSDQQCLEAQIVENAKRVDLSPLELAEAYRRLHREHGLDVDAIAEKVGKKRRTVYAAMKLCELVDPAKKALAGGEINESVAKVISLLPAKLQPALLKVALERDYEDKPKSLRQVEMVAQRDFMLDLRKAVFDTTDEKLVEAAGACKRCEKRTGAQPDMFEAAEKGVEKLPDLCTDKPCHESKVDAHLAQLGTTSGVAVIDAKEAKKLFNDFGQFTATEYVNADENVWDDQKGAHATKKKLLGKHARELKEHLVKTPRGEVLTVYAAADYAAALKKAKAELAEKRGKLNNDTDAGEDAEKEKAKRLFEMDVTDRMELAVNRAIIKKCGEGGLSIGAWRALAVDAAEFYDADQVAATLGWVEGWRDRIPKASLIEAQLFVLKTTEAAVDLAGAAALDTKELRKKVEAELRAEQKAKTKEAAHPVESKKPRPSKATAKPAKKKAA